MGRGDREVTTISDVYGLSLTATHAAADAYNRGVGALLRVQEGGVAGVSESIAHDPTFALGHAALALLGYEYCAPVDIDARLTAAIRHVDGGSARERSHVHAVASHVRGNSRPMVSHLRDYPLDALAPST